MLGWGLEGLVDRRMASADIAAAGRFKVCPCAPSTSRGLVPLGGADFFLDLGGFFAEVPCSFLSDSWGARTFVWCRLLLGPI